MDGERFYSGVAVKNHLMAILFSFAMLVVFATGIAYLYYFRTEQPVAPSAGTSQVAASVAPFKVYANDEFRFRVTLPNDWVTKVYQPGLTADDVVIAFGTAAKLSANKYVEGESVGIRLFSVASHEYTVFVQWRNKSLQSPNQLANLGGSLAYKNNLLLAAERSGYVYEMHLSKNPFESNTVVKSFEFLE